VAGHHLAALGVGDLEVPRLVVATLLAFSRRDVVLAGLVDFKDRLFLGRDRLCRDLSPIRSGSQAYIEKSSIPWHISRLHEILLDTNFLHALVDFHRPFLQVLVKAGVVTRKFCALKAKIHAFVQMTILYLAFGERVAGLVPAPLARCFREIFEHYLEVRVFFKDLLVQEHCESLCIHVEVTKAIHEALGLIFYRSIFKINTFFTV
jgi:hypothetical protein